MDLFRQRIDNIGTHRQNIMSKISLGPRFQRGFKRIYDMVGLDPNRWDPTRCSKTDREKIAYRWALIVLVLFFLLFAGVRGSVSGENLDMGFGITMFLFFIAILVHHWIF